MPSLQAAVLSLLLLTPVSLAAGRELAPRPLGPSAYAPQTPHVAYAGGKYLTVWLESLDRAGWRYLGAFSDANGQRISPAAFVVIPYGIAGPAQLIGTGDSFALFFAQDDGVQMLDIDLTGRVTADRLIPLENFRYDPSVAWNGTHFAVVEHQRLVTFDRAGTIVRGVDLPCRPVRHELLAVRTDFIVAGVCEGSALRADVVAADGTVTTAILDPVLTQPSVRVAAAPAADGTTLVAWGAGYGIEVGTLSSEGFTWLDSIADSGERPLAPLVVRDTPDGVVAVYLDFSTVKAVKRFDHGLLFVNVDLEGGFGHPATAASDGTNVLVADVHYESQLSRGRVRTRLITGDNAFATRDLLSIVPARQLAPAIGTGSESLVAVWTELQGTTKTLKAARVAPDGTPLSSAVIDPNATLASRDVVWNGSEYLTVILRNDQLRAQRINAFGERAGSPKLLANFPSNLTPNAAIVWTGSRWEVAWADGATAFYATVAPDGDVTSVTPLALEGLLADERVERTNKYDVALAYDGGQIFLAWIEGQYVPCQVLCIETRPAFVTTVEYGGMQLATPRRISDPWAYSESLSLAANGDEAVAVVNLNGERAVVTSPGGASRTFDATGDVTWDGSAFVLALREQHELTVRRLDANLGDAARTRVANIAPADTHGSTPSVAAAIPGNAIVGIQECEANSGGRAVAFVEQELGPEPQRRRAVRR